MSFLVAQKDVITKMYQNDKLSIRTIAKRLCVSASGVKRILHKFNVPRRNKCESLNLCPSEMTQDELDVVLGSSLGDGHITRYKPNGESCLYIGHSTKQKEYIEYKYKSLNRWIGCNIYTLSHHLDGKQHKTLNFITRRNNIFTTFRNMFYANNDSKMKTVPYDYVSNNLNPKSLAIWVMDDGYNQPGRGFEFCSENFSIEDQERLIEILKTKFNLDSYLVRIRKSERRIKFRKASKESLFNIVKPHVISSMKYKVESSEAIRQTSNVHAFDEDMVRSTAKVVEVL